MRAVKESSQQLGRYNAPVALECIPQDGVFDDDDAQIVLNEIHRDCVPDLKVKNRLTKNAPRLERNRPNRGADVTGKGYDETLVAKGQCDK
jgi:hypothetical protein